MDLTSALIGLGIFLLFFAPIMYIIVVNGNSEKKLIRKFKTLASIDQLTVENIDIVGHVMIGMDEKAEKLLISITEGVEEHFEAIPLRSITECRVKSVRLQKKLLDQVALELSGKDFKKELSFYLEDDETAYVDPEACLQSAYQWEKAINSRLTKN